MDRLALQSLLEVIQGNANVYFQPPPGFAISYPCIVYHVDSAITEFSDNMPHRYTERYQVTCISQDPDEPTRFKVAKLPMCTFSRWFAARNLSHYVYNLYI